MPSPDDECVSLLLEENIPFRSNKSASTAKLNKNKPDEIGVLESHAIPFRDRANAIRALAMDAVEAAASGHPGMPMGMADVATILFCNFLKFDPQQPHWPDRDRFVLSAGHGSMLLYAILHLTGYADMTLDELKRFRQLGARTAGHPEYGQAAGIETTSGPLGQGLASSVGMALAERLLNARFGDDLVDHYTYVIAGDGCLMEGISHEAIDLAGHLRLGKLIVLFDDNGISIDGPTSLTTSMNQLGRFAAAGWDVSAIDGHDPDSIHAAISAARQTDKPSLIACRTLIGFGAPGKQGKAAAHGAALGADEIAAARIQLGWPHAPFVIPAEISAAWQAAGQRGQIPRHDWENRLKNADPALQQRFAVMQSQALSVGLTEALATLKRDFIAGKTALATRHASRQVLTQLRHIIPHLLGGSADLSESNGTRPQAAQAIQHDNFSGDYLHYGAREHAMAAMMNGIALHGGFIPYGGSFLAFSDYNRPALRLAALSGLRVIHVMSHDSIELGEDGPTHQPVEHLAALRMIPNLLVFRPADAVETLECWILALDQPSTPSILCLSRHGLPILQRHNDHENPVARGAYILRESNGPRDISLLATGSEVALAVAAAIDLEALGLRVAVISMPCWELFARQTISYRHAVLGRAPRIGIEAALRHGWDQWLDRGDVFIGMTGFGASAPRDALYRHFGITPAAIVAAARSAIAACDNSS